MGMTINELANKLIAEGYKITPRTIKYYIEKGLLPEPDKQGGYKEGVKLFYLEEEEILSRLRLIFEFKGKGYKLTEIKVELAELNNELHYKSIKKILDGIVKKDGKYFFSVSEQELKEQNNYTLSYIPAKNINNFVKKYNNDHKKRGYHRNSLVLDFDYTEIQERFLYTPYHLFNDEPLWETAELPYLLNEYRELFLEYELSWHLLAKIKAQHEKNMEKYLFYPNPDGVCFTEGFIELKLRREVNQIAGMFLDYLIKIRRHDRGSWDYRYTSAEEYISDFLDGKCAFVPGSENYYFLKRF